MIATMAISIYSFLISQSGSSLDDRYLRYGTAKITALNEKSKEYIEVKENNRLIILHML